MQTIYNLPKLYKRDTTGKIREWTIQYGWNLDETQAGTRVISGLQDGKKVTSEWYIKEAKNVGRANATTNITQAKAEAQSEWDKRVEKEYFEDVASIDSYTAFKPMLANDFTKTPVDSGITQPKLDGIRCIANGRGLYSRANKPIVAVPHIENLLKTFIQKFPTITLDGELYNHSLKDNFQKITSLVRKTVNIGADELAESAELVQYHVYDMFDSANPDMNFMDRYLWLEDNLPTGVSENFSIQLVETKICDTATAIDMMYGEYTTAGYEGQMIRQNTPYEFKRTKNLLKRKEFITEEYRVVEVQEGNGNWAGYAKRFILELADGTQFSSGVRGSQDKLAQLLQDRDKVTWATCRYFELSNDGVPRFPVVIDYGSGTRDD